MTDELPPRDQEPAPRPAGARSHIGITIAIALALIASLLGNALLGARMRNQRDEIATLRAQVTKQQADIDALRGDLRGPAESGPLQRVAAAVERLRGLRFKTAVRPEVLLPSAFRDRVRREILTESDRADIVAAEKELRVLGVIPDDFDLFGEVLAIQEEQVAGFYDNKTKKLVVPAADVRSPSPLAQEELAHEYAHALTDQHFDLGRLDRLQDAEKDDEATAYLAFIEGDAEAVRKLYEAQVLTADERRQVFEEARSISTEKFSAAPKFIQDIFLFPYDRGAAFVDALIEQGGFGAVNAAYRDPPRSTEQILHPRLYLERRDDPVPVAMPDVRAALGAGWKALDDGEVGELDVRLIAEYGGEGIAFNQARAAAEGWDGGSFGAFESRDGVLVAMLLAWDSVVEAREAARLLGEWLPLRYHNVGQAFDAGSQGRGWAGREGAGAVLRNRDRVLVVLGPAEQVVRRARTAFGGF